MYSKNFLAFGPGLVIFIIDQSEFMNVKCGTESNIETAAAFINSFIADLKPKWIGALYRKIAYIVVIEHGGNEEEDGARIVLSGWIGDFIEQAYNNSFENETQELLANQQLIYKWVMPHANGCSNLVDALELACTLLNDWNYDFAPLLINISNGKSFGGLANDDYISQLTDIKDRIEKIAISDGSPLICNIVLNEDSDSTFFSSRCHIRKKDSCLYNLSSFIPKTLTNFYNWRCYGTEELERLRHIPTLQGTERLFFKNPSLNVLKALGSSFIAFYTHEWCGMYVGHPNDLLNEK